MQPADRDDFLAAMRRVASSVCVVTTDGVAGRRGATVSAFCSVSADPPTVLVCLNGASRIAEAVRANGVFAVNVLPEDAALIADRLAGADDRAVACRFDGIATKGLSPELPGAMVLTCRLTQAIEKETHLICIGKVGGVTLGASNPLTYLVGSYRALQAEGRVHDC